MTPCPKLNGLRVQPPNEGEVYLIDQGYKRHIPNSGTYENLFRDWKGIIVDISTDQIPTDTPISDGAVLATGSSCKVYLIDNGQKRWISSSDVFDKYHFAWGRIYKVPNILLDSIPDGPTI